MFLFVDMAAYSDNQTQQDLYLDQSQPELQTTAPADAQKYYSSF